MGKMYQYKHDGRPKPASPFKIRVGGRDWGTIYVPQQVTFAERSGRLGSQGAEVELVVTSGRNIEGMSSS